MDALIAPLRLERRRALEIGLEELRETSAYIERSGGSNPRGACVNTDSRKHPHGKNWESTKITQAPLMNERESLTTSMFKFHVSPQYARRVPRGDLANPRGTHFNIANTKQSQREKSINNEGRAHALRESMKSSYTMRTLQRTRVVKPLTSG